jgi:WD40 repeat protein
MQEPDADDLKAPIRSRGFRSFPRRLWHLVAALGAIGLAWFVLVRILRLVSIVTDPGPLDEGLVYCLAFSPDGKRLVAGTDARRQRVHVWDIEGGREVVRLMGFGREAGPRIAFSPDGRVLACERNDGPSESYGIQFFDAADGREVARLSGHKQSITSFVYLPGGGWLLSASFDRTLRLWDVNSGQELRRFTGHTAPINSVAVSPDGRRAVSGAGGYAGGTLTDPTCRVWDIETGKELLRFSGHEGSVESVAFSPDGAAVASGGWDNMVRLWDANSGRELRRFDTGVSVNCVAFSPDGRRIVSGGGNGGTPGRLWLWDAQSGKIAARFDGQMTNVMAVAFSPDGRRVASGGGEHKSRDNMKWGPVDCFDCDVRLWDTETGKEIARLPQQ